MANVRKPKPTGPMNNTVRMILFWSIIIISLLLFWAFGSARPQLSEVPISDVISRANKGEITGKAAQIIDKLPEGMQFKSELNNMISIAEKIDNLIFN